MEHIDRVDHSPEYVSPEVEVIVSQKDIIMFNGESTGDEPQPGF